MMDYAGRVAQADTYPKLLRLNAKEHGGEIALREKDLGLWRVFTWNDYQSRVHDFALGMVELGLGPRRRHRHHRRQPAGLGLGGNRDARDRRHVARPLSRRAG